MIRSTVNFLLATLFSALALWAQTATQTTETPYALGASGSRTTTVSTKLSSFYEAVADFGADPTGRTDATAASQAAINAALAGGTCALFTGGTYQLSYSAVASLVFQSNSCMKGDGPNRTIFLERTPGATVVAVTGHDVTLRDFFLAMAPGVRATEATGLELYPDVTSTTKVAYTRVDYVSIASQWCDEDPSSRCGGAANVNRLKYGILVQSGAKDNVFNSFRDIYVRWASEAVYLLSGGLSGSHDAGAVNANYFSNSFLSDATDCIKMGASGENYFLSTQCTNASHAEITFTSNPFGGSYGGTSSTHNYVESMGEASSALVDFTAASSNTVMRQSDEADAGTKGNLKVLGKDQNRNSINAPGIFQTGFYDLSGAGKSVDPFICSGMIDIVNAPCTASIDFSGSANNPVIMRIRGRASSAAGFDYYNLTKSLGHVWRDDPANPLTIPVATFQKMLRTGINASAFIRLANGVDASTLGDLGFEYMNSSTSHVTVFAPGVISASGTEVYPLRIQGDGVYRNDQAMTTATQLPACTSGNVAAEVHNYPFATSNNLGAPPGSGGAYNVAIRCGFDGSTYKWTIYSK